MARRFARELGWFAFFLALSVLMTWPWVLDLRRVVPDRGDPYFVAWLLAWDFRQTFRDPLNLFDANIVYPLRSSLAFSENLYGVALPLFPLFALGLEPMAAQGVAEILAFAFCGYGMFRLLRTVIDATGPAVIAAIAFAFVPWRFEQLPHLPYVVGGWVPVLLESIILLVRAPSWRRAAWMAFAFVMNALSCLHWFVLTLIPLAVSFVMVASLRQRLGDRGLWSKSLVAGVAAGLLLLPFLLPYRRVARDYGFVRSRAEAKSYSAVPGDWIRPSPRTRLYPARLPGRREHSETVLFAGAITSLLAATGLLLAGRHCPWPRPEPQALLEGAGVRSRLPAALDALALMVLALLAFEAVGALGTAVFWAGDTSPFVCLLAAAVAVRLWIKLPATRTSMGLRDVIARLAWPEAATGAVWTLLGFAGSLGLNFALHRTLWDHALLFRSLRVPARWALVAYVGLAFLAGLGAHLLMQRIRRVGVRRALTAVLALGLLLELRAAPLDLEKGEPDAPPVYPAIRDLADNGGLVELPAGKVIGASYTGSILSDHYYVLRASDHWKPLVTAHSGFLSPQQKRIEILTRLRPIPDEFFDHLESIPASYLIVHHDMVDTFEGAAIEDALQRARSAGRVQFLGTYAAGLHRDDLYVVLSSRSRSSARVAPVGPVLGPGGVVSPPGR